jgi:amino acid adenylation domain-containing protein
MASILSVDSVELLAFHRLFELQVAQTPDRAAVFFEEECWTYQDLAEFTQRIATNLFRRGLAEEECVGICVDRSPGAIAAMLGIMRAGGAFVPLDPELPVERIQFMLDDAGIKKIICDQKYADLVAGFGVHQWITLEALQSKELRDASELEMDLPEIRPDQLAYVMYTSGSTGKPKGVMIEAIALTTYCLADIDAYKITEQDRTLHFSTINFDIAIEEIFPPLLTGGAIVVRPRHRVDSHNELSTLIRQYNVTAVHLATAYWHEWVDLMLAYHEIVPESLRLLIATGEKVSVEHFRRWNTICPHEIQWSNAYGPTEATVSSTVFTPNRLWSGESMPIGKPLKRYEAIILNPQGKQVEPGELGELFIAGPALARGYLNRPELTSKAFIQWIDDQGAPKRIYRTGDLARWDKQGDIEFAGRIDHQIKVGSYRIEPGEIESAINQHSGVCESLVVYEQIGNQKVLIAFVATQVKPPCVQSCDLHSLDAQSLDAQALALFLREHLPAYMIPQRFLFVDRFPKTLNGKIDRHALPSVDRAVAPVRQSDPQELDKVERELASIWSEVLQVSKIGREDNFFFLGGSSLLVTRVIAKIKQRFNLELPVRDVFANPVLQSLAGFLKITLGETDPPSPRAIRSAAHIPKMEAQFLASGDERLFSIFYPARGTSRNHPVLICGSVGHEYARSHRNLQQMAQLLSENGFDVLRFDYSATGNSSGACGSWLPEQWCSDIQNAASWLRKRVASATFSAIGLRLGATLLSNAVGLGAERAIFWDPALTGASFLATLTSFQSRAERDYVRYSIRRNAEPHQFYGLVSSERAVSELAKLRLTWQNEQAFARSVLLTTKNYWCEEVSRNQQFGLPQTKNHHQVDDEVMWHFPQFTEKAFSSAKSYRWILDQLTEAT